MKSVSMLFWLALNHKKYEIVFGNDFWPLNEHNNVFYEKVLRLKMKLTFQSSFFKLFIEILMKFGWCVAK